MDINEALAIVLDLAEQNVLEEQYCDNQDDLDSRQAQEDACEVVRNYLTYVLS